MTEQAQETVAPASVSRQDAIAAAGATADAEAPITDDTAGAPLTTDDVAGTKPATGEADRQLVAPSVREFLRAQAPKVEPEQTALEKEISDLRGALDGLAGKDAKEPTVEERMLGKLEALENRETARLEKDDAAREEEEYNNRVRVMREGVIENINARGTDFPGLIALEQQETVFNALVTRSQEGVETSEDEIASEVESGLRTVYETLHKVYGTAPPSEDQPKGSEPKVTLTPGLSSTTDTPDIDKMSRSEKIEFLWAKSNQS
jgi:hypothetical protein